MWLYFCVWCAIIASVPVHHNTMEAFAFQVKRLPDIFWNTSNPIFRIDNTDHIIDVNQEDTGNPFDYDRINIVCPVYEKSVIPNAKDTEQFVIYHVTKEEYDTCIIRSHSPRIIAQCNSPYRQMVYPISFRSFTPMPNALEYRPGLDYHFISTSSKDDLHLRIGGMCLSNNMKIVFKVGLRHETKKSSLSDTNSGKNKDIDTLVNRLSKDASSKRDDTKSPEEDVLPKSVNNEKITQKVDGKGKKHRGRRKNGERKKKKRRGGGKKNNNNKDHHSDHRDRNDVWDSKSSTDSCPPGGCSPNVVENHNNFDYTMNKKLRNNYLNQKGYVTGDDRNRYGEMPSRDEKLMNDKPRGVIPDERSDVAKVHDLMRQEPSISASSSAPTNSFLIPNKPSLAMITIIVYTFLSRFVSQSL